MNAIVCLSFVNSLIDVRLQFNIKMYKILLKFIDSNFVETLDEPKTMIQWDLLLIVLTFLSKYCYI